MTARTPRHYWQTRPSADRLGNAPHIYGKLQPLQPERKGWLARLFRERRV